MQNVQRQFGKLMTRSADESRISILLKEFNDADTMLAKLIDASKAWRDAWLSIFATQLQLVAEFDDIYRPIVGASAPVPALDSSDSGSAEYAAAAAEHQMRRTGQLRQVYEELKAGTLDELNMVDTSMVRPAMDAKDSLQHVKKSIKKREDRKLDFERYQSRLDSLKKKQKRSPREDAALQKAEADLARATQHYKAADEQLCNTLPPLINATFALLPHLLSLQILIQNNLLAHTYTLLHAYCQQDDAAGGFAAALELEPSPSADGIVAAWRAGFRPVQHELETGLACLAYGKVVRKPMEAEARNSISGSSGSISSSRPLGVSGVPGAGGGGGRHPSAETTATTAMVRRQNSSPLIMGGGARLTAEARRPPGGERTASASSSSQTLVVAQASAAAASSSSSSSSPTTFRRGPAPVGRAQTIAQLSQHNRDADASSEADSVYATPGGGGGGSSTPLHETSLVRSDYFAAPAANGGGARSSSPSSSSLTTLPKPSPSSSTLALSATTTTTTITTMATAVAAAAKKKKPPPPPPPPKRTSTTGLGLWVTALYSFGGQSAGDLAFSEGDKIRVVKRTDSTDDWWEGELRGIKGAFPANYCRVG